MSLFLNPVKGDNTSFHAAVIGHLPFVTQFTTVKVMPHTDGRQHADTEKEH